MNVGELFIKLGFDVDSQKLKDFQTDLQAGFQSMLKITAAATAAIWSFDHLTTSLTDNSLRLQNFKNLTGESTEELQKWQAVVNLTNPSMGFEQTAAAIQNVNKAIASISMGNQAAAGAAGMLIGDVRGKSAFEVLEELRNNYQKNIRQWGLRQTNEKMAELGVDPGMISAIQMTRQEFDKFAEGRFLSPETTARLVEFRKEFNALKLDFQLWSEQKFMESLPSMKAGIEQVIPVFHELAEAFQHVSDFVHMLPGEAQAAGFVGFMYLLTPRITLFTAAIVGLSYALNDITKYFNGDDSFIGKMENKLAHSDVLDWWVKNGPGKLFGWNPKPFDPNMVPRSKPTGPIPGDAPYGGGIDITDVHNSAELDRILGGNRKAPTNSNVTVHNNIEIHSNGDPLAVGQEVQRVLQPSYDRAGAQLNNGPAY